MHGLSNYPLLLILSLVFYNTDLNKRKTDATYFDYQEFGTYLLFLIPLVVFKTKIFYLISLINKKYSQREIEDLLEEHNIDQRTIRKTRRKINIIDDTDEDGINMASHYFYNFIKDNKAKRMIKPILSKINPSIISNTLSHLEMELNDNKIQQIINQVEGDLKRN